MLNQARLTRSDDTGTWIMYDWIEDKHNKGQEYESWTIDEIYRNVKLDKGYFRP